MRQKQMKIRSVVRRDQAESYLLTSLVAFAATVIVTRAFLEWSGYPQIGNDVLHIAHALWGGLLLFVAALLPLSLANRWALQAGALLGGVGTGLFIDEVGKFITQANDYFFPPSLSIIYAFLLLTVPVYLYLRRPHHQDPRNAMYHTLEVLKDALDGDLDIDEAARIEAQLAIAKQSGRDHIASLANAIGDYLKKEKQHLPTAEPGYWNWLSCRFCFRIVAGTCATVLDNDIRHCLMRGGAVQRVGPHLTVVKVKTLKSRRRSRDFQSRAGATRRAPRAESAPTSSPRSPTTVKCGATVQRTGGKNA